MMAVSDMDGEDDHMKEGEEHEHVVSKTFGGEPAYLYSHRRMSDGQKADAVFFLEMGKQWKRVHVQIKQESSESLDGNL
jgi:hypothetical protein